jgi:hypothetical protein
MTAQDYGHLVTALLGVALVVAVPGWTRAGRVIWPPFSLAVLLAALAVAGGAPEIDLESGATTALAVGLAGGLAVIGGGPVTGLLFRLVDRETLSPSDSIEAAAAVLRGGLWIGLLERAAVFVSLVASFPEGVAIALAVKGLGRYPELRAPGPGEPHSAAAERFIIGTFASVLWAGACAGAVILAR